MTANTTQDGADARSGAVIEHPSASQVPPEVAGAAGVPNLESRIKERRTKMIEKIDGLRGDRRPEAVESRDRLKAKLSELAHLIRWGVVDDWASVSVPLVNRMEQWLAEAARQMTRPGAREARSP